MVLAGQATMCGVARPCCRPFCVHFLSSVPWKLFWLPRKWHLWTNNPSHLAVDYCLVLSVSCWPSLWPQILHVQYNKSLSQYHKSLPCSATNKQENQISTRPCSGPSPDCHMVLDDVPIIPDLGSWRSDHPGDPRPSKASVAEHAVRPPWPPGGFQSEEKPPVYLDSA